MRRLALALIVLASVGCRGAAEPDDTTTTSTASPAAAASARDAVVGLIGALADEEYESTRDLVFEEQLALLAAIEGESAEEAALMLTEGVPEEVRANFWSSFAAGVFGFTGEELADVLLGSADIFTIEGVRFTALPVTFRRQAGMREFVTRRDAAGGWRVDLFATFGTAFVTPLRTWLEEVPDDDAGDVVRRTIVAQRASLLAATTRRPLGEVGAVDAAEVEALMEAAGSRGSG